MPAAVTAQVGGVATDGDRVIDKSRPATSDVIDVRIDTLPVVKLNCHGHVETAIGVVGCVWRAEVDSVVASWQLWNLQTRPQRGSRHLVAELGADVRSYRDPNVVVPAAYVYAVVGLDADGDIVARSRLSPAVLHDRDRKLDILRLECDAHRVELDIAADPAAEVDPVVSIGCEWSATDSEQAVGYQLWRSVDGGERHLIASTSLGETSVRDHDVSRGHRYRYVVSAVDPEGRIVGRSRAATVALRPPDRVEERVRDLERDQGRGVEHDRVRDVDVVIDPVRVEVDARTDHNTDSSVDGPSDRPSAPERDRARHNRPTDR